VKPGRLFHVGYFHYNNYVAAGGAFLPEKGKIKKYMMKIVKLTPGFISWVALIFLSLAPVARAESFQQGDKIVLTQDTSLFLNNVVFRVGKKGDAYTILLYRPETKRVYVAAKDEAGHDIALNMPDSVVARPMPASIKPPEAKLPDTATKSPEASPSTVDATMKAPDAVAKAPGADAKPAEASGLDATSTMTVQNATYLITTDDGSGSAFLARMDGRVYLVTNYHVVKGASKIECSNQTDSIKINGGTMEVADDRDLVRFPVDKKDGLEINTNPVLDNRVAAFGNSGGKDVVTKLDGKVLGVGPQELEVSCEFIPGNSGGPIADEKGKVVGIATYVATQKGIPDWVKKGTRFEGTRRFGVRLVENLKWSTVDLMEFQKETKVLVSLDGALDDYTWIASNVARDPFHQPFKLKYATGQDITNLVEMYNQQCRDFSSTLGKSVTSQELDNINRKYHARIKTHLNNLARIASDASRDIPMRYRNLFTIPHTRNESIRIASNLQELSAYIGEHANELTPTDLLHFRSSSRSSGN